MKIIDCGGVVLFSTSSSSLLQQKMPIRRVVKIVRDQIDSIQKRFGSNSNSNSKSSTSANATGTEQVAETDETTTNVEPIIIADPTDHTTTTAAAAATAN